jgi:hypothetical protein
MKRQSAKKGGTIHDEKVVVMQAVGREEVHRSGNGGQQEYLPSDQEIQVSFRKVLHTPL